LTNYQKTIKYIEKMVMKLLL